MLNPANLRRRLLPGGDSIFEWRSHSWLRGFFLRPTPAPVVIQRPPRRSRDLLSSRVKRRLFPAILAFLILPLPSAPSTNDSAASIPAGGIQLRGDPSISMEKERLTIGLKKVEVEYEFRNDSDRDISTEVAFLVPRYQCDGAGQDPHFRDFRVWVEGAEVQYQTILHAIANGEDRTKLLIDAKIPASAVEIDINKCYEPDKNGEINRLPASARKKLTQAGLIDEDGNPIWTVEKIYHWPMTFPARKIVHVRHEYSPALGQTLIPEGYFKPVEQNLLGKTDSANLDNHPREIVEQYANIFRNACVNEPAVEALAAEPGSTGDIHWVDYLLTTANTWKTPIKDFTLIVDTSNPANSGPITANFCWDTTIRQQDPTHLIAEKKDFPPEKELSIYFMR